MQNRVKSSKPAQGAGATPIFQVTIHGYYNPNVSCALIYTDIYQAATREEAIGMAVDKVNRCYPLMMIKGNGIKCSLLNPIAL